MTTGSLPRQNRAATTQRGAALVIALVVVLLVGMLATRVSSDYLVLFRGIENQTALQQARAYLRGAEYVAKEALLRDLLSGSVVDSSLELWARPLQVPLPEGILDACLEDLQGRLNLNDLAAPEGTYSAAQKRFIRLLQVLDIDEPPDSGAAVALANAVFDWVDADSDPRYPGGAEELDYLRLPQPYRPANQAFISTTELRLVSGLSPALVAALTPNVSVWGNGNLNLNALDAGQDWSAQAGTAASDTSDAPEPVMLRTLNNPDSLLPLSRDAATMLANLRSGAGGVLQDLTLFNEGPLAAQNWELDGVALSSEFFLLDADMRIQNRRYRLQSVLQRSVTPSGVPVVAVLSREFGSGIATGENACAAALR
jgi:general secretion pathway protein K